MTLRKEVEMLEVTCDCMPEELADMDAITVNGVEFVPMRRLEGVKALLIGYLEDSRKMLRERDDLIRDMLEAVGSCGAEELRGKSQELRVRAEKLLR